MSDTQGPLPPPPRKSHGCLWGCLIAAVIGIAAVATLVYVAWHLLEATKNTDAVKTVMATVDHDGLAHRLFGDHIAVGRVSNYNMHSDFKTATTSFEATIEGSKGAGTVDATVLTQDHRTTITSLVLTTSDGHTYDISHGDPPPPDSI